MTKIIRKSDKIYVVIVAPVSTAPVITAPATTGPATTAPVTTAPVSTETPVATNGAITIHTNVKGAAITVVSGTSVIATINTETTTVASTSTVANGTYTVVVSKNGYKDITTLVTVNGDITVDITLEKTFTAVVDNIDTAGVTIVFLNVEESITGYTPEIIDNKGNVVPVTANDIAKGNSTITFNFATTYPSTQEGIWTIDGISYDFTEIANVKAIAKAAEDNNQVNLIKALTKAGIKNVNKELVEKYIIAINEENKESALKTYKTVQRIIDKVNEDEASESTRTAVLKELSEAKTQLALFEILKANFERVNDDWFEDYILSEDENDEGFKFDNDGNKYVVVNNENTLNKEFTEGKAAETYTAIQTIIDNINKEQIVEEFNDAKTVAAQDKVTVLIDTWFVPDKTETPSDTPKANAKKNSQIKSAALAVKEAANATALYNALVAYAKISPDTMLKETALNDALKADYKTALDEAMKKTEEEFVVFKSPKDVGELIKVNAEEAIFEENGIGIETLIVKKADEIALTAALTAIYGVGTNVDNEAFSEKEGGLSDEATPAQVKEALQKVADVTSHKSGEEKFDITIIYDDQLTSYLDEFIIKVENVSSVKSSIKKEATRTTVRSLVQDINDVNGKIYIKIIKESNNATEVKNAILELAIKNMDVQGNKTTAEKFINLSKQEKDEVVAVIIAAKADNNEVYLKLSEEKLFAVLNENESSMSNNTIAYSLKSIETACDKFNAIGNLAQAKSSEILTALEEYTQENVVKDSDVAKAFNDLSTVKQLEVVEYMKGLVNTDNEGKSTPKDFSGQDAVKTLAEANAYILAGINSIK